MAFTSILAAMLQALQSVSLTSNHKSVLKPLEFIRLSRWNLLNSVVSSVSVQMYVWIISAVHGATSAAALQAVINVVGLCHPAIFGTASSLLPEVVSLNKSGGITAAWKGGKRHALHGMLLIAPYLLVLSMFPELILRIFYGKYSAYLSLGTALRLMAINYVFLYGCTALDAISNGIKKPLLGLLAQAGSCVASLAFGMPLTVFFGVTGASAGTLLANLSRISIQTFYLRKVIYPSDDKRVPALSP